MKYSGLLILVAGVCTALLGAYGIYAESAPLLRGGTNAFTRLNVMSDGSEPLGLSLLSQNYALRDCQVALKAIDSPTVRLQGNDFQARLPALCSGIASQVLTDTPAHGQAHLILAMASARMGDLVAMDTHLRQSQALAPSETRYADPRSALAGANVAALSEDGLARYQSDLLLMLRSQSGVWTLAQRYIDSDVLRPEVTNLLPLLTPNQQSRFLGAVNQMISMRGKRL